MLPDQEEFVMPDELPQTDREVGFETLLDMAPPWNVAMAYELLPLVERFVSIRSALGFPMEMAVHKQKELRSASSWEQTLKLQGALEALDQVSYTILEALKLASSGETNAEYDNESA